MGIPSYFSFIVKNYCKVLSKLQNTIFNTNNFYLDCNSIIYDCIHNINIENIENIENKQINIIIQNVFSKIDYYINIVKPSNYILIAFDGVAPVAKLEQQRTRRYKSVYQNNIYGHIFPEKKIYWDTAAITPGTHFMKMLNEQLYKYFKNKYNNNKIIISGSDCVGEGEHKIFNHIRAKFTEHKDQTTIIYGLDSDLIMLSLNHLHISDNIFLFRETPEFIKSINMDLDPNENYILNIAELSRSIISEMTNHNNEEDKRILYDYIFICFFLGNDFMPHFPALNIRTGGVYKMINAYAATISSNYTLDNDDKHFLTNGEHINWINVKKLVKFLAEKEETFIIEEVKKRDKYKNNSNADTPEKIWEKFQNQPVLYRNKEKFINVYSNNWRERYYNILFDMEIIDEIRIEQICLNFLQALEWNMKYYTKGCADWRWYYKYNYPPLLNDLIKHIPYFNTNFFSNSQPNPVNELVQLCYVLPKYSLHLLPSKLFHQIYNEHPEWYKEDCKFIWAFCKYFWESHVDLPHMDINELETIVNKYIC